MTMDAEGLRELHFLVCTRARNLTIDKNRDYTGGSSDPFANFRTSELLLGVDARLGILLRTADKMQRLRSFIARGHLAVTEESVDDAIIDIINYMILLKGLFDEERKSDE